jgi:hypothetical protein
MSFTPGITAIGHRRRVSFQHRFIGACALTAAARAKVSAPGWSSHRSTTGSA